MIALTTGPRSGRASLILGVSAVAVGIVRWGAVLPDDLATVLVLFIVASILVDVSSISRQHATVCAIILGAAALVIGLAIWQNWPSALQSAHPAWSDATRMLGAGVPRRAATAGQPLVTLGSVLAVILAALWGVAAGAKRPAAVAITVAFAVLCTVSAAYGVMNMVLGWLGTVDDSAQGGVLVGTFVNRNTAATVFGCGSLVWIALAVRTWRRHLRSLQVRSLPDLLDALATVGPELILYPTLALALLAATFATLSRSGVAATLTGAVVVALLCFPGSGAPSRVIFQRIVAAVLSAAAALEIFGSGVILRFQESGGLQASRLPLFRDTLTLISQRPLSGHGLGTFVDVYPAVRSADVSMWGVNVFAHSTPLEFASEGGLLLAAPVAIVWCAVPILTGQAAVSGRRSAWLCAAATGVWTTVTLHASVDFSLQIPGVAIAVVTLLGAALGVALTPSRN